MSVDREALKALLDANVDKFDRPEFIHTDPISVPHRFTKKQDIEIAGLLAAILSWGQRPVIISKSLEMMRFMDFSPHEFVLHHKEQDLKPFLKFKHRTFNATDALYFIHFLRKTYEQMGSMEKLFLKGLDDRSAHTGPGIEHFRQAFISDPLFPHRTGKHVATPARNSACKRINMFLRWMVRRDKNGVDFGIWKKIEPRQLICPLDVHVERMARKLGLLERKQRDWHAAVELTEQLRLMDPEDPVKYDYALFGIGVFEKAGR